MECFDNNELVLATAIPWLIIYKIVKRFVNIIHFYFKSMPKHLDFRSKESSFKHSSFNIISGILFYIILFSVVLLPVFSHSNIAFYL